MELACGRPRRRDRAIPRRDRTRIVRATVDNDPRVVANATRIDDIGSRHAKSRRTAFIEKLQRVLDESHARDSRGVDVVNELVGVGATRPSSEKNEVLGARATQSMEDIVALERMRVSEESVAVSVDRDLPCAAERERHGNSGSIPNRHPSVCKDGEVHVSVRGSVNANRFVARRYELRGSEQPRAETDQASRESHPAKLQRRLVNFERDPVWPVQPDRNEPRRAIAAGEMHEQREFTPDSDDNPSRVSTRASISSGFALVVVGLIPSGCSGENAAKPPLRECTATHLATNTEDARDLLEDATPGTCILLGKGDFEGPLVVPAGVALVGDHSRIVGPPASTGPLLVLSEGSLAAKLEVESASGVGVAIHAASARLDNVFIHRSARAAVAAICEASAETCRAGTIVLSNVSALESGSGFWISGAHVFLDGSGVTKANGTYPGGGIGVLIASGARVDAVSTTISGSASTGVFIDGERTKATFRRSGAGESGDHGIYVQGVRGTIEDPAVALADFNVEGNHVALGAFDSSGVVLIRGTAFEQTRLDGRDGVAIVASGGSTEILVERSGLPTYEGAPRAAAIVQDSVRGRIEFVDDPHGPGARPKVAVQGATGAELILRELDLMQVLTPIPTRGERLPVPTEP